MTNLASFVRRPAPSFGGLQAYTFRVDGKRVTIHATSYTAAVEQLRNGQRRRA
jgi:hypothetical protein